MTEIVFMNTSLRDGNQSLWDATGLRTNMILSMHLKSTKPTALDNRPYSMF